MTNTTSNKIIASVIEDALHIPLESLHSQADSITYVFKKDGLKTVKQEVIIGDTNANDAILVSGLTVDDRIYLSVPPGLENQKIELLPEMNGKRKKNGETTSTEVKIVSANPVNK